MSSLPFAFFSSIPTIKEVISFLYELYYIVCGCKISVSHSQDIYHESHKFQIIITVHSNLRYTVSLTEWLIYYPNVLC